MRPPLVGHIGRYVPPAGAKARQTQRTETQSFQSLLQQHTASDLKISKHAAQRMQERGIELSADVKLQMVSRLQEAKAKGITDALVVTQNASFIVNVPNNTIVTALGKDESQGHIFTNINGTLLL
ncbi:MAG: TIGR02530 family flagellar biosynthesis protein [Bacilli bacterium]